MLFVYVVAVVLASVAGRICAHVVDVPDGARVRLRMARNRVAALLAVVVLAGCGTPSIDVAVSDANGAIVWKDATGKVVANVSGPAYGPIVFSDDRGFLWRVDPDTLAVTVMIDTLLATSIVFTSHDCSGPGYVPGSTLPLPNETFVYHNDASTVHVRPATLEREMISWCSASNSGTSCGTPSQCLTTEGMQDAPTLPSPPAVAPVLNYVAPLHPEVTH